MEPEADDVVVPSSEVPARDSNFVQSLDRGLAVIRAFDAEHPRLQLSEVARATGLTRAAARRFLLTLVQLGYVRMDGREFSLRPRVLELGYTYRGRRPAAGSPPARRAPADRAGRAQPAARAGAGGSAAGPGGR